MVFQASFLGFLRLLWWFWCPCRGKGFNGLNGENTGLQGYVLLFTKEYKIKTIHTIG